MTDDLETLRTAVREELAALWSDLHVAQRSAMNGQWSIQCGHLEHRIKQLTPLVEPTPWEEIQIPLLENSVYQRIHAELGIEVSVDMERVAGVRQSIDGRRARAREAAMDGG